VTGSLRQAWEAEAEAWTAWARAPRHDAFAHLTLDALRSLLPEQALLAAGIVSSRPM
jgi:hypothetical protein